MRIAASIMMLAIAAFASAADEPHEQSAEDSPWFDLQNCGMCRHLSVEEDLMDHMQWENYRIATGMMSITTIDEGYEAKFKNAQANMEKAGEKLMAGEHMPLCGMCRSFGELHQTGKVQWENWETPAGHIMLMTSTDPDAIEMIHEHAQKTIEEYARTAKQVE